MVSNEMITSTRNPKIQWVRGLQARSRQRRQDGAFVVEGVRLCEEALHSGWQARLVLYTPEQDERLQALVAGFTERSVPLEQVTEHVLKAASDTKTPQGVLVVLEMRELPLPASPTLVFIPDGVRDPGNLGAMLRTAAAAVVDAVLLPPGVADPYAPKVVRSAMGAHFRLPLRTWDWDEIRSYLTRHDLKIYLAEAGAGLPYTRADLRQALALIIGGEAAGAGDEARSFAQDHLHIPMPSDIESLNAAAAAAVLLFELARQRGESAI